LLIQNEFFVWTGGPNWYKGYSRTYDPDEMIRQYTDWMRDNWNTRASRSGMRTTRRRTTTSREDHPGRPAARPVRPTVGEQLQCAGRPERPVEYHPYLMSSGYGAS
jgi:hypothetical protein